MRQIFWLLLLAPLMVAAQDDDIGRLVESLHNDSLEIRQKAAKSLVKLGAKAGSQLKKAAESDDAEVRVLASEALREIERDLKLAAVLKEIKPFDVDFRDTPLSDVFKEIARQSGLSVDSDSANEKERITLKLSGAPLMRILDGICEKASELRWEFVQGVILFLDERHSGAPSFYSGAFKLDIRRLLVFRSSVFPVNSYQVMLDFRPRVEPGVSFVGTPVIHFDEVKGGEGEELKETPVTLASPSSGYGMRSTDIGPFQFSDLRSASRKLSSIKGEIVFYFVLASKEIMLKATDNFLAKEGDISISGNLNCPGMFELTLKKDGDVRAGPDFLDSGLFELTYSDKTTYVPQGDDFRPGRNGNQITAYVYHNEAVKTVEFARLRVFTEIYEKKIPFEFKDVPLP